jgi:hypothetical protein
VAGNPPTFNVEKGIADASGQAVMKCVDRGFATVAVVKKKDRRKTTQFLTLSGSNELTCPTAGCQWIAGRLGLRVKDAGDCREDLSRHVSSLSKPRQGQKKGCY